MEKLSFKENKKMHSRIYGVLEKKNYEVISKQNGEPLTIKSDIFNEPPFFADYVDDDVDVNDDIKWLCENLKMRLGETFQYNLDKKEMTFKKGYKEKYFKDRFEELVKLLTQENSFERFITYDAWRLKDLIESEFSFYVCDEYGSYVTLDSFIRESQEDVTYIICGSIDYHF